MGKLVCEICGGSLLMNADNVAECESCGVKYAKEKVASMVKIDGAVEITKGEAEKERLLKNAETFIELGELEKAKSIFRTLANEFPDDACGWLGLFRILLIHTIPSVHALMEAQGYEQKINQLAPNVETDKIWNYFFQRINQELIIVEQRHNEHDSSLTILDDFQAELLCCDTNRLNYRLRELQKVLGEQYSQKLLNGKVQCLPNCMWTKKVLNSIVDCMNNFDNKVSLFKSLGFYTDDYAYEKKVINIKSFFVKYSPKDVIFREGCYYIVATGTILYGEKEKDDNEVGILNMLNPENSPNILIKKIEEYKLFMKHRADGVCQYCGGKFKGFLNKRCSVCGKEKDY